MTYSFSYLDPVCCSTSSSNCCFLPACRCLRRQVGWSGLLSLPESSTEAHGTFSLIQRAESCFAICGIWFLGQGWNLGPLHCEQSLNTSREVQSLLIKVWRLIKEFRLWSQTAQVWILNLALNRYWVKLTSGF